MMPRAACGKLTGDGELSGELAIEQDLPAGSKLKLVGAWKPVGAGRYLIVSATVVRLGGSSKRKHGRRLAADATLRG